MAAGRAKNKAHYTNMEEARGRGGALHVNLLTVEAQAYLWPAAACVASGVGGKVCKCGWLAVNEELGEKEEEEEEWGSLVCSCGKTVITFVFSTVNNSGMNKCCYNNCAGRLQVTYMCACACVCGLICKT